MSQPSQALRIFLPAVSGRQKVCMEFKSFTHHISWQVEALLGQSFDDAALEFPIQNFQTRKKQWMNILSINSSGFFPRGLPALPENLFPKCWS